jgi:integral membrane sensor domain MASE1
VGALAAPDRSFSSNFMNIKNWPYWFIGGGLAGIIGTLAFALFPDKFYGNEVSWYLGLFSSVAFVIFAPIALLFQIDFISEAASSTDRVAASIISYFSFFITFFMAGVLVTIIYKGLKSKYFR